MANKLGECESGECDSDWDAARTPPRKTYPLFTKKRNLRQTPNPKKRQKFTKYYNPEWEKQYSWLRKSVKGRTMIFIIQFSLEAFLLPDYNFSCFAFIL